MAYVNGGRHFGQYTYEHWFDHEYGNANSIIVDELAINEIERVSSMIDNIFDEFVGMDYSVEGNKTFKDYIKPQNIKNRFIDKGSQFLLAKVENEITGIMEIKNKDHISLFFIKKEFQGKGIGKYLFRYYLDKTKNENNEIKKITIHSSVYAENIYSRLGFKKINEIQEKDGIKYIPMEYEI
jgi:GNAT superfamily N-acetyltransferase